MGVEVPDQIDQVAVPLGADARDIGGPQGHGLAHRSPCSRADFVGGCPEHVVFSTEEADTPGGAGDFHQLHAVAMAVAVIWVLVYEADLVHEILVSEDSRRPGPRESTLERNCITNTTTACWSRPASTRSDQRALLTFLLYAVPDRTRARVSLRFEGIYNFAAVQAYFAKVLSDADPEADDCLQTGATRSTQDTKRPASARSRYVFCAWRTMAAWRIHCEAVVEAAV